MDPALFTVPGALDLNDSRYHCSGVVLSNGESQLTSLLPAMECDAEKNSLAVHVAVPPPETIQPCVSGSVSKSVASSVAARVGMAKLTAMTTASELRMQIHLKLPNLIAVTVSEASLNSSITCLEVCWRRPFQIGDNGGYNRVV